MGQAASQPDAVSSLPQGSLHISGGGFRSSVHSLLMAGLFASGLALWLWPAPAPAQALVLWAHLATGLGLSVLLLPWLWHHVPLGLQLSQRRVFTQTSWALLAFWLVLLGTGLIASLPALFWFSGWVWFPTREVSEWLSFLHFWASWGGIAGLGLHLGLRHWVWGAK